MGRVGRPGNAGWGAHLPTTALNSFAAASPGSEGRRGGDGNDGSALKYRTQPGSSTARVHLCNSVDLDVREQGQGAGAFSYYLER